MDLVNNLEIILTYLEKLNEFNGNKVKLENFKEQWDNIKDLKLILKDFQIEKECFISVEKYNTKEAQEKSMIIIKFLEDLSWHISEIQDLNYEMINKYIVMENN